MSRKVNFIDCTLSRELCTGRQSNSLIALVAMSYCANFLASYKLTRIVREEYFIACDVSGYLCIPYIYISPDISKQLNSLERGHDCRTILYVSYFATKAANVVFAERRVDKSVWKSEIRMLRHKGRRMMPRISSIYDARVYTKYRLAVYCSRRRKFSCPEAQYRF